MYKSGPMRTRLDEIAKNYRIAVTLTWAMLGHLHYEAGTGRGSRGSDAAVC